MITLKFNPRPDLNPRLSTENNNNTKTVCYPSNLEDKTQHLAKVLIKPLNMYTIIIKKNPNTIEHPVVNIS